MEKKAIKHCLVEQEDVEFCLKSENRGRAARMNK